MTLQNDYLTVPQAAAIIGVTPSRVRQMLRQGEIAGEQLPRQENGRWLIKPKEAARVAKQKPTTGRPRSGGA